MVAINREANDNMLKIFAIAFVVSFILASLAFAFGIFAMDCSNCSPGACICNIPECSSGTLSVYSTQCSGIPTSEFIFSNNTFVWTSSLAQNYYFKAYCDNGTASNCTKVNLTTYVTATTTTASASTTTTTPASLSECPNDCCIDETGYYNKYCDVGYDCVNGQCVTQSTTTTPGAGGFQISYSLIGIVAIIIVFAVFVYYFFMGRKTRPEDRWSDLYKKYGRR